MSVWHIKTAVEIMLKNLGLPSVAKWESPVEALFLQEAEPLLGSIACQHQIGRYRVDFAIPEEKIAIEIDGREFHRANIEQIVRDQKRQRDIQDQGWMVIRFTGAEVYRDARECAMRVRALILRRKLN